MFERYTEKARRVIFFARYEASQFGSPSIESEHLLLGLVRESHEIARRVGSQESIREQVEKCRSARPGIPTSVDLPLSGECKRILEWAAEEAERLAHRHIGTEHLLLGLLREQESLAARILHEKGEVLEQLREHYGTISPRNSGSPARFRRASPIKIHDFEWNGATIRERVHLLRQSNWYWERKNWKPRDLVVREDGRLSFDVKLARNPKNFDLRRNGWKSDHC
jgi:ATP-dependent Clp protease ATP-binding subunit ClpA